MQHNAAKSLFFRSFWHFSRVKIEIIGCFCSFYIIFINLSTPSLMSMGFNLSDYYRFLVVISLKIMNWTEICTKYELALTHHLHFMYCPIIRTPTHIPITNVTTIIEKSIHASSIHFVVGSKAMFLLCGSRYFSSSNTIIMMSCSEYQSLLSGL